MILNLENLEECGYDERYYVLIDMYIYTQTYTM